MCVFQFYENIRVSFNVTTNRRKQFNACHTQLTVSSVSEVTGLSLSSANQGQVYCCQKNTRHIPTHSPRSKEARSGAGGQKGDPDKQSVCDVVMAAILICLRQRHLCHSEK